MTGRQKDSHPSEEPFQNVKSQIGYCGIWCGSCAVGNGALREITKKYEEIIKNYGLKEWVDGDFDFKEVEKGLSTLQSVVSCPGCLKGGGRDNCELKACAVTRHTADCTECSESKECTHTEILNKMRSGALQAGLFVKMEKVDRQRLIEEWADALRSKWPSCILFCEQE